MLDFFFSLTNFQSNELVPAWLSTAALQMILRLRAVKQQLLYYLSWFDRSGILEGVTGQFAYVAGFSSGWAGLEGQDSFLHVMPGWE